MAKGSPSQGPLTHCNNDGITNSWTIRIRTVKGRALINGFLHSLDDDDNGSCSGSLAIAALIIVCAVV